MYQQKKKRLNVPPYNYALFLLSLRSLTQGQLEERMFRRGYETNEITEVISRLAELKYLDDRQFAQIYLENLKKYKQIGYYGVKKKMLEKKIPLRIIDKALLDYTPAEEKKVAKTLLTKYTKKTAEQKLRALRSKGFRSDVITALIKIINED
jgi:regulatory protein